MHKNICHLLMAYGNKNQRYTSDLIHNLSKSSNDDHFVYCHRKLSNSENTKVVVSTKQPISMALMQFLNLYATDKDFRKLSKELGTRSIYKWLYIFSYRIDVLHVHHAHAIPVQIIQYLKIKGVKVIISLRGRDLLVNTYHWEEREILKNKLVAVDKIHCISYYMKDELLKMFGLDSAVVYRGLQFPLKMNVKQSHNNSNNLKLIVAGRLEWEKGHIYLIESIYRLTKMGYVCEVDIYGDGSLKEALQFRINQLDLNKVIHLKGYLDNTLLRSLYKEYDIAVQPSLTEALSNGLIDFMFHNLPCVITNVDGMPEIIEDGVNGIIFNNENMLELDNAILEVKNIDFEKLIRHNKKIRNKFTSTIEVEELLNLYC